MDPIKILAQLLSPKIEQGAKNTKNCLNPPRSLKDVT